MQLDVRIPLGLMLAVIGLLLAGYGLVGDTSIYARSLGINVNLIWGCVLIVVATILLMLATRKAERHDRS